MRVTEALPERVGVQGKGQRASQLWVVPSPQVQKSPIYKRTKWIYSAAGCAKAYTEMPLPVDAKK